MWVVEVVIFMHTLNHFFPEIKYTGLDFDHKKMKSKKFKNDNFKIIAHDLRKDWFFGEFDFVWSSEVIEHLF